MIGLYSLLLVLHLLSMAAVIGTTFVVPVIRRFATTAGQLRFALGISTKLAMVTKVGGSVLIGSGVWLMILSEMGLSQVWLNASILLSLLIVVTLAGLIEPRIQKAMRIASESREEKAPAELARVLKNLVPFESAAQLLLVAVLLLMVVKPF